MPPLDVLWEVHRIGAAECHRRGWGTGWSHSVYHGKRGRLVYRTERRDFDNHIEVDPRTGSITRVFRRVHHATALERALGLAGASPPDAR
jgi:hypothetical protein